jgi:signal transduction histidine kinase
MANILLVDDRADNLLTIETILEPGGYNFVKASSGREALKILLTEFDFALILMDVKMPNLNGFETATLIYEREKLRHIPIVFVTAHSNEENIFKGYKAGAVDYIYKPLNPELLRAKVSVFVELYRKNHQLMAQEKRLISINKNLENEISERKLSEEKVKALNIKLLQNIDKLEDANRDLDRFAFMASHDLQEPLRKIRTYAERLSHKYKDQLDEEGKKYIDRIENSTARLQVLIKDIMTFSQISEEKKTFVKCDLNSIINEIIHDIDSDIQKKKAEISVDALPQLHLNPVLIRPLFHNLIHNALKYSKSDIPPKIKIYVDSSDKEKTTSNFQNKYCRILIEDNGIGFDQKYSEQIFVMFKRLHQNNMYEGTGIGLALCKKIVEEHNGFISAKSTLGEGSVFIVSLPVKNDQLKEVTAEATV